MTFRILLVPGVNPDRWLRVWQERLTDVPVELVHAQPDEAVTVLRSGRADVALVRLPVTDDDLSTIPLYTESTVVVVPKDHVFSVVEEIDAADLEDELLVVPLDDQLHWADAPGARFAGDPVPMTTDAVELVAAGVGVLVLPQSLGRLHQRRGLVARTVRDAPGSAVGLAWVTDRYDDLTEEFIGIVRGRTATSSRGRGAPAAEATPPKARGKGSGTGATGKGGSGKGSTGKGGSGTGATGKGGSGRKPSAKGTAAPRARKPRPR